MDSILEPITETDERNFCVEMMKRLDIQRRNEQFCDVILEVGSGDDQARLKAHRIVLCAASPFFYNALNSDMKEKKEGVIRLEETSKAVMEEVLEYLYTGHVDINEHSAFDLLKIADYLIVPSLKELSRDFILRTLSSSSCFMAYYYAARYLCPELEETAQDFTFDNFMSAAESDDFLNLSMKQVEEWVSSDQIFVDEEEQVFQVIVKWMEKSEKSKHQSFFQLFRHVRLIYVSRNYLFDVILPHPLVKDSKVCSEFVFDAMREVSNGTEECYFAQPPRNCLETYENAIIVIEETTSLCYVPSEDKWYRPFWLEEKLPHQRKTLAAAMAACHGKLYVVGGNYQFPAAECYDPLTTDSWNQVKSFNLKTISYAGVVCFQGHLYVIGGEANTKTRLSSVLKYNPDTDLWHRVAPLSSARSSVCAVADSKSLYVIGGNSSSGYLDIAEKYDPDTDSWSKISSTIRKRSGACGAVVREKVFVFGGLASKAPSVNFIEMYDPAVNYWIRIHSAIVPRGFSRAVGIKRQIFVLRCCHGKLSIYN